MSRTAKQTPVPPLQEKIRFLCQPWVYPEETRSVQAIETHMSWIFLTDTQVYKLKKPVRYPYLDFSTLEARRRDCEKEVRLNRRLSPSVYLGTTALAMDSGRLWLNGSGQPVEWLVRMVRLPAGRMLDRLILVRAVNAWRLSVFVNKMTSFYRSAAAVRFSESAYIARFRDDIEQDHRELCRPEFQLDPGQLKSLRQRLLNYVDAGNELGARAKDDRIVDAHGDLRPEHVCLTTEPQIIDCMEFKRDFRLLDPLDELAYLALECERLGDAGVGRTILATYALSAPDPAPSRLVDFYRAFRAHLRAKIAAWHLLDHPALEEQHKWCERTRQYLGLAEHYCSRL